MISFRLVGQFLNSWTRRFSQSAVVLHSKSRCSLLMTQLNSNLCLVLKLLFIILSFVFCPQEGLS